MSDEECGMSPFDRRVLQAVFDLEPDGYGVPLRCLVEQTLKTNVSYGALYGALDRLEERGLITSTQVEGGATRGYRERRNVELTPAGCRALATGPKVRDWDPLFMEGIGWLMCGACAWAVVVHPAVGGPLAALCITVGLVRAGRAAWATVVETRAATNAD
jgi:DNA-binding MarR family transcriptional regulator